MSRLLFVCFVWYGYKLYAAPKIALRAHNKLRTRRKSETFHLSITVNKNAVFPTHGHTWLLHPGKLTIAYICLKKKKKKENPISFFQSFLRKPLVATWTSLEVRLREGGGEKGGDTTETRIDLLHFSLHRVRPEHVEYTESTAIFYVFSCTALLMY